MGLLALLLGVSVYVLDRPALETYFVPQAASLYTPNTSWFGVIGNYLPDFLHAFAFCLITIGVLGGGRQVALFCGLFWLLIESLFELGQHNLVAHAIAPYIPGWFDQLPVLENTRAYFTAGHFDPLDLLAIALGVLAAYGLARTSRPQH